MRPVLRPGLRLHRDPSGRAVLVERDTVYPLDDVTANLLGDLDGLRDDTTLLRDHAGAESAAAWRRLLDSGVVVDVEAPTRLVRGMDATARGHALPDATAVVAHGPAVADRCWDLRRRATVAVDGQGVLTAGLASVLRRVGVGTVLVGAVPVRSGLTGARSAAALTVLTYDHEPPTSTVEHLMREGRVHLVAGMRGTEGVVGPLVRPGATSCLRCVDLARCAADRRWGPLRDQLAAPAAAAGTGVAPASSVVVTAATALAAAEVLAHLEGRTPVTLDATASMSLHRPLPVVSSWPVQPACGCAWHAEMAAREQWTA